MGGFHNHTPKKYVQVLSMANPVPQHSGENKNPLKTAPKFLLAGAWHKGDLVTQKDLQQSDMRPPTTSVCVQKGLEQMEKVKKTHENTTYYMNYEIPVVS